MSEKARLDQDERIVEIEMERLRDFKNHPFKIMEDRQMEELVKSIQRYGILNPIIVRPLPEGIYPLQTEDDNYEYFSPGFSGCSGLLLRS